MSENQKQSGPEKGMSRRQFLKGGLAAASVGAAAGLGYAAVPYKGILEDDYPEVPENNVSLPKNGKSVLILGGGFGGMHDACELLDRGFDVTIIEKSAMLGGKFKSWRDKDFGVVPDVPDWKGYPRDVGIHGVWGCYNNLREFMGCHDVKLFKFPNDATTFYNFLYDGLFQKTLNLPSVVC